MTDNSNVIKPRSYRATRTHAHTRTIQ